MTDPKGKAKAAGRQERQERLQGQNRKILGIGLGLVFVVLLLSAFNVFDILEYRSIDWRFKHVRGPRSMQVPAVVVGIDDESLNGWLDAKGKPSYMPDRWPFPRDFHATVIRNLKEAGARLIAFDIVFSESSKRDPKQDEEFARAAKEAGNVVFGERQVVKEGGALKVETLIPGLDAAKLDKGFVNVYIAEDGYLRGFQPLFENSSHAVDPDLPGLDLAVLRQYLGIKARPVYDQRANAVRLGDKVVPLDGRTVDINFAGPVGTVPTVPYHSVYYKTADMSQFKGKVVYIGSTTDILKDNQFTPFSDTVAGGPDFPGVESHIHFLDTMLTGQYLRRAPGWLEQLLVLVLGVLTSFLTFRVNARQGAVVALLIASAWVVAVAIAFEARNLILPMVSPLSSVVLSFAGLATYRGVVEERKARDTKKMFSRYVSRQIVDEILKNPGAVKLGGEMKETTILFSDVRGFTAMSEKLSAPEVVEVLNEYLTAMVDIVIAHNGTLDKYVGDAIMAVWGSPLADPDHKRNAVKTAVQMMERLKELQAKWKAEGKPHIDIGIGLNTGHVVAGNMGHPDYKMDYTVIGDDVNLAARMESANKDLRSHVLITGSTYEGCEDLVDVIRHEPIKVKGKEKPIEVFEIVGWKGQGRAPWAEPLPLH